MRVIEEFGELLHLAHEPAQRVARVLEVKLQHEVVRRDREVERRRREGRREVRCEGDLGTSGAELEEEEEEKDGGAEERGPHDVTRLGR